MSSEENFNRLEIPKLTELGIKSPYSFVHPALRDSFKEVVELDNSSNTSKEKKLLELSDELEGIYLDKKQFIFIRYEMWGDRSEHLKEIISDNPYHNIVHHFHAESRFLEFCKLASDNDMPLSTFNIMCGQLAIIGHDIAFLTRKHYRNDSSAKWDTVKAKVSEILNEPHVEMVMYSMEDISSLIYIDRIIKRFELNGVKVLEHPNLIKMLSLVSLYIKGTQFKSADRSQIENYTPFDEIQSLINIADKGGYIRSNRENQENTLIEGGAVSLIRWLDESIGIYQEEDRTFTTVEDFIRAQKDFLQICLSEAGDFKLPALKKLIKEEVENKIEQLKWLDENQKSPIIQSKLAPILM